MRAILRRLRREESGLSLTEVLVSAFLTIMILVMVGNMFVAVTKITTMSNQNRNSNDVATNIMNEASSVIRVTTNIPKDADTMYPGVAYGDRSKLIVYSLSSTSATSPAPSKITFELLALPGNTLLSVQETTCTGSLSGTLWVFSSTCTVRNLGTGVLAPDSSTDTVNQLFTYLDGSGNPILIGTSFLSDANRADVASIIVRVRAKAEKATTAPVVVTNTVVLRNLGLDTAP